jgi:adenosyl cobinamide kinase/adenosyl cobinamide phosphate guanylyltransferase
MLTPELFEVNEAWIAVRINEEFLFVKDDPYDMFVLVDAASAYVLGFVFSKAVEAPTVKDVEALFKKAWDAKKQWATKLIVADNSISSSVFVQEAEKKCIASEVVPMSDLYPIIGPLKESFEKDFIGSQP